MKILSIDPSASHRSGWATFDTETQDFQWGHYDVEGFNFRMKCIDLWQQVSRQHPDIGQLVCEWPMYYGGAKGQVAAQMGYTINLAGIVMYLAGAYQLPARALFHYTAPQWKGSVPKQVTARRFLKMFGEEYARTDHNTVDAVMLLVFHLQQIKDKLK